MQKVQGASALFSPELSLPSGSWARRIPASKRVSFQEKHRSSHLRRSLSFLLRWFGSRDLLVVVSFSSSTTRLGCLRKGSSSAPDIHNLIGFFWDFVTENHIEVHFRWVPSKLNLGDRPSRNCAPIVGRQTPFRVRWTQILQLVNSSKRAHLHDSFEVKTVLSE